MSCDIRRYRPNTISFKNISRYQMQWQQVENDVMLQRSKFMYTVSGKKGAT